MPPAESVPKTSHRGLIRLLVAIVLGAILWSLAQTIAPWGGRNWAFVLAVGLIFILVLLLGWVLEAVVRRLFRFVRSVSRSMWKGFADDPEVLAITKRHPRLTGWLARRTTLSAWSGMYLTLIVITVLYFLSGFISIAQRAVAANNATGYDTQLSGLLRSFRTPDVTRFLWLFTVLGDSRVAFTLTAIVVLLLLLWSRRADAILLAGAVAGGGLIGEVAKTIFRRARPETFFSLITEPAGFSFPSGHALYAALFWGVLGFLLIRASKTPVRKVTAFIVCAGMATMTALSRVYLGVHWTSDVMASWALALACLSACIGAYLTFDRYGKPRAPRRVGQLAMRRVATVAAVFLCAGIVLLGTAADPLLMKAAALPPTVVWASSVDASGLPTPTAAQAQILPHASQNLGGTAAEPIGLIFVGTQSQLTSAFSTAGWVAADPPNLLTTLHTIYAAFSNQPYPTAPVTPSFVTGQVNTIAFEKPAGTTIQRRHHARWWLTDFTFGGRPVWVATASFDISVGIGGAIPVPTHHIEANIDAEQSLIASDLAGSGVRIASRVRVSPPGSGTNTAGDTWFTEGLATVLVAQP